MPGAVESYRDIPAHVRQRLRERMERREYDDMAVITRDAIVGEHGAYGYLRGMHFGAGRQCSEVDRSAWARGHEERGLVYREAEHCLIVPTVCRNVSRVTKLPMLVLPDEPTGAGPARAPTRLQLMTPRRSEPTAT